MLITSILGRMAAHASPRVKRLRTEALVIFAVTAVQFVLAACTVDTPQQRIAMAQIHLQKNDLKSALIEVKGALQKDSASPEARYLLGSILAKQGNNIEAELEYRSALSNKHPEYLVVPELAKSMLALGKHKKLTTEFGETRFHKPASDSSLQTTLARAYFSLAEPDLARRALDAALLADPSYAPALLLRAQLSTATGDFDSALQLAESIIAKEPKNAEAWKLKGDISLVGKRRIEDAIIAYHESVAADADFLPARIALVSTLLRLGKLNEATAQISQIKKTSATGPQIKLLEGQLAFRKKDVKLAREISQQLLKYSQNNPVYLQFAGTVELQQNSLRQAETFFTRASQAAPQMITARRLLILTYLLSGQTEKALGALHAASGEDDLEPGLLALAGEAYLQIGDAKRAEEYFTRALKLSPDDTRSRTQLAIVHLSANQMTAGLEELQAVSASTTDTAADLALIGTLWRRREYNRTLAAISALESKQPDRPLAAHLRGRLQLEQGDNNGARRSFEQALKLDQSYFAAAAALASLDVLDRKPEDAKRRFEAVLVKDPSSVQALISLAQLAATQNGSTKEVATFLERAVNADPGAAAPRTLLVELYLKAHDVRQALGAAQNAASALPDKPEILDALGRAQLASGDPQQAIATFARLATAQPASPIPYLRLAAAYSAAKNNVAAERSLRRALEITPDQPDALQALVASALQSKKYKDALTIVRAVQKQRPKSGFGFSLEGDILALQGDWMGATNAYRASLQRTPFVDVAIRLYAVTRDAGHAMEAKQFAAGWISTHPKDSVFLSYLGASAMSHKDYLAAEKYFRDVLEIRPNDTSALNNMALTLHLLHKEGALGFAQKANDMLPNHPLFMDTLAQILSASGNHSRAIEIERKALGSQPRNLELRLNLVKFYIAAGDRKAARAELGPLSNLGGKHPLRAEVDLLLKTL